MESAEKRIEKEGIVLSSVKYGDNGVVVSVLTRDEGRKAFMASATSGKRGGGGRMAMLLPLSLIGFVPSGGRGGRMGRMSQTRLRHPAVRLQTDPVRRAVAMFMAELLYRSTPEEVPDPELFEFADEAVRQLDSDMEGAYNFHLWLMMHLADYLGIGPERERGACSIFDLEAGTWVASLPPHAHTVDGRMADLWERLECAEASELAAIGMNRTERQELIELMSTYYRLHLPSFGQLKSVAVLAMLN